MTAIVLTTKRLVLRELCPGDLDAHMALFNNPGDHEIGWLVREDRWRMGYAYEAMRAVTAWGFTVHAAPHLVAITVAQNVGSQGLMRKLGMQRRADLDFPQDHRKPDLNHNIVYAITRKQWTDRT